MRRCAEKGNALAPLAGSPAIGFQEAQLIEESCRADDQNSSGGRGRKTAVLHNLCGRAATGVCDDTTMASIALLFPPVTSGPDSDVISCKGQKMSKPKVQMKMLAAISGLVLMACNAPGQTDTIFPSDGQALDATDEAELLEAVCPGKVGKINAGTQLPNQEWIGCPDYCPQGAPLAIGGLRADAVYHGHFLSPASEDAVLSESGCETHQELFGGAVLLTKRSRLWKMVWYKPGVLTEKCRKVALRDRREILVCIGQNLLYTEDLLNPNAAFDMGLTRGFFALPDNRFYGAPNYPDPPVGSEVSWGDIERVEFGKSTANGPPPISVTATFGKGKWTAEEIKAREQELQAPIDAREGHGTLESLLPPLKRYHLDFIWDGHDYKPAPASAARAKVFADQ